MTRPPYNDREMAVKQIAWRQFGETIVTEPKVATVAMLQSSSGDPFDYGKEG